MTVQTFRPDDIRIMPTSDDLKKTHHSFTAITTSNDNLIASSRPSLPKITVGDTAIDPAAIAQEMQYHPAESQEEAMFLAAQALVVRELLRQAITKENKDAWQQGEEKAIADLLARHVKPNTPSDSDCQQYYSNNRSKFVSTPILDVRHILLAAAFDDDDAYLDALATADKLIHQLSQAETNFDGQFISFAQQFSACPSKDDGGHLGIIQKGSTVPEFEQALFAIQNSGLHPNPIKSRYGVHIVDIISYQPGVVFDYDSAKPAIINQLTQQSFHHKLTDFLYELSQKTPISGIELQVNQNNVYRG